MELLRNADLFDPAPRGRSHLLVGGERILWIGTDNPELPRSLGITERDLEGRRVIPGLVDCHVHLTGGGGEAGMHTRVPPVQLSRITSGGVTTVIGLLGTDDTVRSTADLVATARGLIAEGLSAWCYTGGYHFPPVTLTGSVRGDIVHIDVIIGVGELAISDHRSSQPTLDELLRVAGDAHVAGMMTGKAGIVHLHVGDGSRGLELVREALKTSELPASAFHPTHVNRRKGLFEEAMALAKQGSVIDVTAFPVEEGEDAWSAPEALTRYLEAGLPPARVTISSDGGGCLPAFDSDGRVTHFDVGRPSAMAHALKTLLDCGQPLERVLPAFTTNPANLLLLPRKGHLTAGADADLVVLDEDSNVTNVMARGRWHVQEGRSVVRGTFERIERW
ncbi:MAG TPA: beta-aspartyl-peptidase [Gemmatimonadales bacterium]|nr:beta-aspartyl-peptidase [Gemmatimonadales bacterium]